MRLANQCRDRLRGRQMARRDERRVEAINAWAPLLHLLLPGRFRRPRRRRRTYSISILVFCSVPKFGELKSLGQCACRFRLSIPQSLTAEGRDLSRASVRYRTPRLLFRPPHRNCKFRERTPRVFEFNGLNITLTRTTRMARSRYD